MISFYISADHERTYISSRVFSVPIYRHNGVWLNGFPVFDFTYAPLIAR